MCFGETTWFPFGAVKDDDCFGSMVEGGDPVISWVAAFFYSLTVSEGSPSRFGECDCWVGAQAEVCFSAVDSDALGPRLGQSSVFALFHQYGEPMASVSVAVSSGLANCLHKSGVQGGWSLHFGWIPSRWYRVCYQYNGGMVRFTMIPGETRR